jgi:hypothetical protein
LLIAVVVKKALDNPGLGIKVKQVESTGEASLEAPNSPTELPAPANIESIKSGITAWSEEIDSNEFNHAGTFR